MENTDGCTIEEKHAYLKICLDSQLEQRVSDRIQADTPLFGEDSCMSILQEDFCLRYLLFNRRLDFFKCQQGPSQKFSDFAAKLRAKGDEADLPALTVDEMYIFRYICSCTNTKLREKFPHIENPTLAKF